MYACTWRSAGQKVARFSDMLLQPHPSDIDTKCHPCPRDPGKMPHPRNPACLDRAGGLTDPGWKRKEGRTAKILRPN